MQKVCILLGGMSPEHEVSIMSAMNVYAAIDKNLFDVSLVYISKSGNFYKLNNFDDIEDKDEKQNISTDSLEKFDINNFKNYDAVFPVMHGPNCEDGSMQGFLTTLGVKYVGPQILSSAICMDKDIQKQIARANGITVTDWVVIKDFEYINNKIGKLIEIKNKIENNLKYPAFVKPSRMGSSVGVIKVKSESDLERAIDEAFIYDTKVIIEKAVLGREIEVAVLGRGNNLTVSNPGEVASLGSHDFYDYDAKYTDANGSVTHVPAKDISIEKVEEFKALSKKIYNLLECEGLSRIDYFLTESGEIMLNEVNTLPGFTNVSMYPKLMEESGVGYTELITTLLQFK
jgi:D-alanine-D-alanine ligase